MKRTICTIILAAILLLTFTSCEQESEHLAPALSDIDFSATSSIENVTVSDKATDYVLIDVADKGKILIRLYPDVAPKSVENFKDLVSDKFYDGTIFHRVIEDFMIQGGDSDGDGISDGKETTIKGEFTTNGFTNNLLHLRGVVSMARTSIPDSASTQFFIMHKTTSSLDGKYAAFGYVVYGMDVVDAIAKTTTDSSDRPMTDIVMTSVRFADVSGVTFDIK